MKKMDELFLKRVAIKERVRLVADKFDGKADEIIALIDVADKEELENLNIVTQVFIENGIHEEKKSADEVFLKAMKTF
jgi:hypothetical protein